MIEGRSAGRLELAKFTSECVHVDHEPPDQLAELIEDLARAKEAMAAAQLDVKDRQADEAEAKARTERAERCLRACVDHVDRAWKAVRKRIDAQTHSAFEDEIG